MRVLKVNVISLPYIFQVVYVLCFTRPRYQVSVYRTIGPLVYIQIGIYRGIHYFSYFCSKHILFLFVSVEALRPNQQFFSHVGTEPPLPGYYQYFLGR